MGETKTEGNSTMAKTTKATTETVATVTAADVKAWWPAERAKVIVQMMAEGLEYWRAVRRSRRYFIEGKV